MEAHRSSCLCLSTAVKGAHAMSLKSFSLLLFALHFCFVPDGTGRAHTSVSHSDGGAGWHGQLAKEGRGG